MNRRPRPLLPAAAVLVVLLASCARYTGPIGVELTRSGSAWLSPGRADGIQDTAAMTIKVSRPYEGMILTAYAMAVYDAEGDEVWRTGKTAEPNKLLGIIPRPTAVRVPDTLTWDGKVQDGGIAEDGRYTIVVDVWDALRNTGRSGPVEVLVDNTPPRADLFVDSLTFSPDADGRADTVSILQRNPSLEGTWTGEVRNQIGGAVRTWVWEGKPETLVWDGTALEGGLQPDGLYDYVLATTDEAGNAGTFTVEGLTLRTRPEIETGTWVRPVFFPPYTAAWGEGLDDATLAANAASLDRAAALLARFPELTVRVEGHAVRINWQSTKLAPLEEKVMLLPLSRKRAEAVRDALIERGVAAERISIAAQGGARPLVSHGDLGRRWQNRRVELYFLEPPPAPEAAPAPAGDATGGDTPADAPADAPAATTAGDTPAAAR